MTRSRCLTALSCVAAASCVWWTTLRADESEATAPSPDRIDRLLSRIEQLERRVQALEGKPPAIQQSTHAQVFGDAWVLPAPPATQPSQPQFGIVYQLKRFIPDPPNTNQPAPDGTAQKQNSFGDVEIRR